MTTSISRRPKADLTAQLVADARHKKGDLEIYDYPGATWTKRRPDLCAGATGGFQSDVEMANASGDVRGLGAGNLFQFIDFPNADQNKQYLVVRATYDAANPPHQAGSASGAGHFNFSFSAMDSQVPFRASLSTPRTRVTGPQTAIVVGESGDEITTDNYGRVKVQFHWDREGKNDENSSCWVRVVPALGGLGVGRHPHPPHRPGSDRRLPRRRSRSADHHRPRLQRGQHAALPAPRQQDAERDQEPEHARAARRATSTSCGSRTRRGRSWSTCRRRRTSPRWSSTTRTANVGNDRTTEIGHDETITVGNNRTESVTKQEQITIGGDRRNRSASRRRSRSGPRAR